MTENESDLADDPWLTLAEIAQELRVNPATVRLWVSRGRLQATRAGQRKLLVRRSELDRMLREVNAPGSRPAESPVGASVHGQDSARRAQAASRPVAPAPSTRLAAGDIGEAVQAVRSADEQWEAALDASANPPPDPG